MSFIYSLISKNKDTILCEYTEFKGNFQQISRVILQKGIKINSKCIINYDKYNIHYINENSITFLLLDEEVNDNNAFSFLTDLKNEILKYYSFDDLKNFSNEQLKNGIDIIKKLINYYNNNPSRSHTGKIIKELNLAKDAVIENIEKIIDRDNKMGIIVSKSDDLKILSMNINSIADNIRKNENSKKNRSIFFVIILVGLIIILFLLIS